MMKKGFIRLIIAISGLLFATIVPAQNLPVLTPDPAIKQGKLPNGLSYYVVTNPSAKGHADFALVQKTGFQTDSTARADRAVEVAKDALASLPRLNSKSPQAWMASHGVTPSEEGFINITSDATVFRFNDVSLSSGKNVVDSTILLLMTIVDRVSVTDDEYLAKWYSPSDQAIVISGDIDAGSLISKMNALSYMTPSRPSQPRQDYKWQDVENAVFEMKVNPDARLATVNAVWRLSRAPREYMNTIQPAIYERFISELGYIMERRIFQDFANRGIPVADVSCRYRSGADGPGDEMFNVSISVADEDVRQAAGALARSCGAIDALSVTLDEYRVARENYLKQLSEEAMTAFKSNHDYVDRCISAFLRNASLGSSKEKLNLHVTRNLPDETQLKLFNDMASALLDPSRNLTVSCLTSKEICDEQALRNSFYSAWSDSFTNPSGLDAFYAEPQFEWPGVGPKVKISSVKQDPMSSSSMWTFSNGFRVIYKNMKTSGKTYWTMAMNGGYGSIDDLSKGEGAYVSDYLALSRIGGIEGSRFRDMLLANGLSFETRVGLTGTLFSGVAPKDGAEMMLKALLAVCNSRTHDEKAFEAYKANEDLRMKEGRIGKAERMAAIDSIMCPDYIYSWMKGPGNLTAEFPAKADKFFERQAAKMNDGVLILVTDIPEADLKKLLLSYVGGFRTAGAAFRRPSVRYQPNAGWTTYTVDGESSSIDVAMSAVLPLTMDNYMTAAVTAMVLEKYLSGALANTGMYSEVAYNFVITPQERLNLAVSVSPLSEMTYASHIDPSGPIEALAIIRGMMQDLTQTKISDSVLASSKAYLKSNLAQRMNEPEYWLDAIAKRYLDGKDFTTSYAAKIDAVTADKVKMLLGELNSGSKVEYVVNKK